MKIAPRQITLPFALLCSALILTGMACDLSGPGHRAENSIPHEGRWGIYQLDLASQDVKLIYSSADELANLDLNPGGDRFAFSQKVGGNDLRNLEVFTLRVDGSELTHLTDNGYLDTYPAWSPDGTQIAYLSWPGSTLDIYRMQSDGSRAALLYDSGGHDGDIDWVGDRIAFTRDSRIWIMNSDGSEARPLTDPPRAGETGKANLPFGDYDPRISPDGTLIVFERLVGDASSQGNYDLYAVRTDGSGLTPLTDTGYAQGLAGWSHAGDRIVYIVSAIAGAGRYDAYAMRPDGGENRNLTPGFFPPEFLIHGAVFSGDDQVLYFIGEWWSDR